ncbi:hypothetical protein [Parasediminibacterium sp. JCM 36343]|uniref:hypothetical protein n=1 Tax=Parasediminibacterium sp. JCM 36343 TaxID=3374279 RepID=UPI00397E5F5E
MLIACTHCFAQDAETNINAPYGSAVVCKGKTVVVNCFVSEPTTPWQKEEKDLVIAKETAGLAWLKAQAVNWRQPVPSFQQVNLGLEKDIEVPKIQSGTTIREIKKIKTLWASYALHSTGIGNIYQWYDSLKTQYGADNLVVLVFANKQGRSYAQPASKSTPLGSEWFVEGAVLYKKISETQLTPGSAIIHEMLHLFGAWDMYHDGENVMRSGEMERKANGAFGNSVMLNPRGELSKLNCIDQLTSWCIGWTTTYWSWYEMFRNSPEHQVWEEIPIGGN